MLEELFPENTSDPSLKPPLIPGNLLLEVLGPDRVIAIAAPIIKEKLFAPLGLVPEDVPILVDIEMNFRGNALGETRFHHDMKPVEIALIQPFLIRDKRPGSGGLLPTLDYVGILTHELVHASIWRHIEENLRHNGHGPTFERYMREIGLVEPSVIGGHSGPKFRDWYVANVLPALNDAAKEKVGLSWTLT